MPKGWLYDWEGIATMGRQNPEIRFGRKLTCFICVSSLSLIDAQKTVPVPIRGQWPTGPTTVSGAAVFSPA
jgi:hypothetical protein